MRTTSVLLLAVLSVLMSACPAKPPKNGPDGGNPPRDAGGEPVDAGMHVPVTVTHSFPLGGARDDRVTALAPMDGGARAIAGYVSSAISTPSGALDHAGGRDILVGILDADGSARWIRTFGGDGQDEAFDVAVLDGDVVVAGAFEKSVQMGDQTLTSAGFDDLFLVRLDGDDGSVVWARRLGGSYFRDVAQALAIAPDGSIYVTGRFFDRFTFGQDTLVAGGDWDGLVLKVSSAGEPLWARSVTGFGEEVLVDVAVVDGDAVVAGHFISTHGAQTGSFPLDGGGGAYDNHDIVVARFGADGTAKWAKAFATPYGEEATAVAATSGGILVAAAAVGGNPFQGTSPGPAGNFVARLDGAGTPQWVRQLIHTSYDTFLNHPRALATASDGTIAVAGFVGPGAKFEGTALNVAESSPFVVELDSQGNVTELFVAPARRHAKALALAPAPDRSWDVAFAFDDWMSLGAAGLSTAGETDAVVARLRLVASKIATPPSPPQVPDLPDDGACAAPAPHEAPGPAAGVPTFAAIPHTLAAPHRWLNSGRAIDLDGDTGEDLILFRSTIGRCCVAPSTEYGGDLRLLRSEADGGVVDVTDERLPDGVPFTFPQPVPVVADLDGDGLDDVFGGQSAYDFFPFRGEPPFVLLQNGDRTFADRSADAFAAPLTATDPTTYGFTHYFSAADVDCRNGPDLLLTNVYAWPHLPVALLMNDGEAVFTDEAERRFPTTVTRDRPVWHSSTFCDVNRDGAPDLLLGRSPSGAVHTLFVNDGDGRFSERANALPFSTFGAEGSVIDLACADFTGDGYPDALALATRRYQEFKYELWVNQKDGTFSLAELAIPAGDGMFEAPLVTADVNGDRWPDLLLPGKQVRLFLNDGDGTFSEATGVFPATTSSRTGVVPFDANGDDRLDLFVFYSDHTQAHVLLNLGAGNGPSRPR